MHPLSKSLLDKTVLVVGCGGLGCNVVEYLARSKIGRLIIVDGDIFEPDNVNRQLYCNVKSLGRYKANVAAEKIADFSETYTVVIDDYFPTKRLEKYENDIDIVVDCLDNVKSRLELERYTEKLGIPLVHGAINGTYGQIATIYPKDQIMAKIYKGEIPETQETMAYVPSLVASLQAAQVVNYLNGEETLRGEIIFIDLKGMTLNRVKI